MAGILFAATLVSGVGEAHASGIPDGPTQYGCTAQTVPWGFLGSQQRTLCDWPVQADGSWTRERTLWTPAHQVPFTCNTYGGIYYSSTNCSGGYFVNQTVTDDQTYVVTPGTVLPDEPGHL
jgi:hypothetical protein